MSSSIMLFLLTCIAYSKCAEEPYCSKYDFEEKVLAKLVRMEFDLELMKSKVKEDHEIITVTKNNVDSRLIDLVREKETLVDDITANLTAVSQHAEAVVNKAVEKINKLKDEATVPTIAFRAKLRESLSPSRYTRIIFSEVMLNEGNGYNPDSGVFSVPVTGTYIFTVVVCPADSKGVTVTMMVDGKVGHSAYVFLTHGACVSTSMNAVLTYNQTLWVAITWMYSGAQLQADEQHRWNTFSGTLIHT